MEHLARLSSTSDFSLGRFGVAKPTIWQVACNMVRIFLCQPILGLYMTLEDDKLYTQVQDHTLNDTDTTASLPP